MSEDFREVRRLRKCGLLDEAERSGMALLVANPDDRFARSELAWVYYDRLKVIRASIRVSKGKIEEVEPQIVAQVEVYLRRYACLKPKIPDLCHSMILGILKRVGRFIPAFGGFLVWAGHDTFREPDDFTAGNADGKQFPSLSSSCAREAAAWLENHPEKRLERASFVLALVENAHKRDESNVWLVWDLSRLYQITGDHARALAMLKRVLETRDREHWVWSRAAEVLAADEKHEAAIAVYARALMCGAGDQYLSPTRIALAKLLVSGSEFAWAAAEIDRARAVYDQQSWRYPLELTALAADPRIRDTATGTSALDLSEVYAIRSVRAEELRFNEVVEYRGSLVGADSWLKRFRVAIDTPSGAIALLCDSRYLPGEASAGDPVYVRLGSNGGTLRLLSTRPRRDGTLWDCILDIGKYSEPPQMAICRARGPFRPAPAGFGFVEGVYVPAEIVNESFATGDELAVIAVQSFDKKRDRWTWKACAIIEHLKSSALNTSRGYNIA